MFNSMQSRKTLTGIRGRCAGFGKHLLWTREADCDRSNETSKIVFHGLQVSV